MIDGMTDDREDAKSVGGLEARLRAVSETCVCLHTRMAARAVTRAYDAAFAPLDLGATQFTLLAAIAAEPSRSVTEMADRLALERTSLSRNLALLQRRGLIAIGGAAPGRSVSYIVTPEGESLLAQALPLWREVQAKLESSLDGDGWTGARRRLRTIRREAAS
jgi:DNA-binding MarR family transcriptional regulator